MLDSDLAEVYGTTTKALNQAVKRSRGRFPSDFLFQLTRREKAEVVTTCDHHRKLKYSPRLPFAFAEHDAVMLAGVLNSSIAVQASIAVVRAFIRLRQFLATHKELAAKLAELSPSTKSATSRKWPAASPPSSSSNPPSTPTTNPSSNTPSPGPRKTEAPRVSRRGAAPSGFEGAGFDFPQ